MNARRIEITLPQERWEQLERARGHEPRASFIKRALDEALERESPLGGVSGGTPTPPRAPLPPGVEKGTAKVRTRDSLAMERQRKLNERKS